MKKWITCLIVMAMAGVAGATTVWNPAANGIVPPAQGGWDNAANWTAGLPGSPDTKAVFNVNGAADCVVSNYQSGFQVVQGDNGTLNGTTLIIENGGTLDTLSTTWSAIGYNRPSYCRIEAGGTYNFGNHCWIGQKFGGEGTVEVFGTITVGQMFGIGFEGGKGWVTVYPGGLIDSTGFNAGQSISAESTLDLWGDGKFIVDGDQTNAILSNVAAGKILGNRLTNNLDVALVVDPPGVTNTVVNAKDSVPSLAGLTLEEATNTLTYFGYTVGTVSEGFLSGAVTGEIIDQDPAAGSAALTPGSSIDVTIQVLSIPDLVGLNFSVATNLLGDIGLTVGTVTTNYIFDVLPGEVLAQNPAPGGSATSGDPVDMTIMEPLAAETTVNAIGSGAWTNNLLWSGGVAPTKETQGFKVRVYDNHSITNSSQVAAKWLVLGDGGPARLDILPGGHVISGQFGNWAAVGYSADTILNVYTGGIFEARENVLYGFSNGAQCEMNIDGGTVLIGDWLSLGQVTSGASTVTTIKNGGSLTCLRFRDKDTTTNGVINIFDGTFAMWGTGRISDIQWALDNGIIKIAPGYSYTLEVSGGNSVLTGFQSGYSSWAAGWVVDIGDENNDYDLDGAVNFYEYVFNGNPTNPAVIGVDPVFTDAGATFQYTHLMRNDDTNIAYSVVTAPNLVTGPWTDANAAVSTNTTLDPAYDEVINSIPKTEDALFIRTKVE